MLCLPGVFCTDDASLDIKCLLKQKNLLPDDLIRMLHFLAINALLKPGLPTGTIPIRSTFTSLLQIPFESIPSNAPGKLRMLSLLCLVSMAHGLTNYFRGLFNLDNL